MCVHSFLLKTLVTGVLEVGGAYLCACNVERTWGGMGEESTSVRMRLLWEAEGLILNDCTAQT